MLDETKNQEGPPLITSKPYQSIMRAETGFQEGLSSLNTIAVSLSLDDDHHLRVYKRSDNANKALVPEVPYRDIAATDVRRVYASLYQIVVKTAARTYCFDLSGGEGGGAQMSSALGGAAIPGGGIAGLITLKYILAKLPIDDWLDAMQKDQFPVKKSRLNDIITKKVLPHLFISLIIGILLFVVLIFIWAFVAINGPTWLIYLEYYLSPR